jgi:signal transduction histidine kinase
MMPELDGYGVLTALRQHRETAKIPLIFLSAKADKADIRQGMKLGAEDYLTKPFTIEELAQAISTQIEKREIIERESQSKLKELRSNITQALPHELRTPLQGILGGLDILIAENEAMSSPERLEMLGHVNDSAQRLARIIQNFLLYAEIEIMAFDPERVQELQSCSSVSPKSLLTALAIQKAQQAGREADLHLNLQDASIAISEKYLHKIAEPIIDNAFKFSPVGSSAIVESTFRENTFILSVLNKGQGMTAEQISKVGGYMQFERKLYEQQGTGLGLIIAKRLTELHGGKLTIDSIPGEETRVDIALPIAKN